MRALRLKYLLLTGYLISVASSVQFPWRLEVNLSRKPPSNGSLTTTGSKQGNDTRGGASVATKTMTLGKKNLFKYVLVAFEVSLRR